MILLKKIYLISLIQLVVLLLININAQTNYSEIAYLHTDRTAYITGESIYFKLYVLDATTKICSKTSKVGYVVLRSENSISTLKIRIKLHDGLADGSVVLPDTLASGVYQLVAFTSSMRNFGEEHFFYKEITIVNRFDKSLNSKFLDLSLNDSSLIKHLDSEIVIKTEKTVYNTRARVLVNLGKMKTNAHVSVSVFEEPTLPSSYKSMVEILNNSSTTQNTENITNQYTPENKGKILRGRVVDTKTKQTVKDVVILLSCIDTVPNLQYAVSNSNGLFQMLLSDYYNGKELFLTIKDASQDTNLEIKIEDEFAQTTKWNPALFSHNISFDEFIVKSQNIVYINKSYQINNDVDAEQIIEDKSVCPQFYHCPVITVFPSDFELLPNFMEIAVEILPQVRIVKENGKYQAQMFYDFLREFGRRSPAIFLDGVFVDDINKIIDLGSDQIKKIDLIATERAFGDLVFGGVISVHSVRNVIANTKPAPYSYRLKNDNVNKPGNFVIFNPNTIQNKYIPFLRQLLYWNPNLEINGIDDTNFEFYTSDNSANFIIKVEGISETGAPISASSSIRVTNQINVTDK